MEVRLGIRIAVLAGLVAFAGLGPAPGATARTTRTTLGYSSPITINDNAKATPYPAPIVFNGMPAPILDVDVTLTGYSHTLPTDVGVLLVAPGGAGLELMDGAGASDDAINANIVFDDSAASPMSDSAVPVTGAYKPTSYFVNTSFPFPGPGLSYVNPGPVSGNSATLASVFGGLDPNGIWSLYVLDVSPSVGSGSIAGGWSIAITSGKVAAPTLTGTSPPSPAANIAPRVLGSAEAGTAIALYASADCGGAKVATGSAAELASPGLSPSAYTSPGSTTSYSAIASDEFGTSPCSAPISYTTSQFPKGVPPRPPETKIERSAIKGGKRKATFTFSGSGFAKLRFECSIDIKPYRPCKSPKTYHGLKPGKHTFRVRAEDASGSEGFVDPTPAKKKLSIPDPPSGRG